jgi:transposase
LVLYDLSSSYFEGTQCPLARLRYSRDGKRGKLQVNYGVLADGRGCPVAVSVHERNTSDPETLLPAVDRVRTQFGLERLVLVGDRGMISHKGIEALRERGGLAWIGALIKQGHVQLDLFDERNLFELTHPGYLGERLVACRKSAAGQILRAQARSAA